MKRIKFGLATQIFVGLILGVIVGVIWYGNPALLLTCSQSGISFYA